MKIKNKYPLFILFIFSTFHSHSQNNVGIGTNAPDASSALEVKSTNQGVLVPRLTTAQRLAVASPANGLLVYDTNFDCFYYYIASTSTWSSLCSASGAVGPTGATGSNGTSGINCWDTNSNGINDASEDTNGDGSWNALDCGAFAGVTGPTGICSVQTYGVNGTAIIVNSIYPSFTAIPGLSQTITLTAPATLNIFTIGGIKPLSMSVTCGSIIRIENGGVPIPKTTQANLFMTTFGGFESIGNWSINTSISLPAGTYTFSVTGSVKSGYSNYVAGANSIMPSPGTYDSTSSLIIQVFY